ncbi:hypothetical protein H2198_007405 [Neophaeococcomyces mojaviensis]|uniref:Uncharacterized protein n=1 Tax=Neophaeococcomyces mojaviensis TaxID=3383035 RepID=A0ACC3A031_9EURO|nr:hypothetical protein H2198_007405 [Knufia sp. JES_112]
MDRKYCALYLSLLFVLGTLVRSENVTASTADNITIPEPNFLTWLPEYRNFFQTVLVDNCTTEYQEFERLNGFSNKDGTNSVINCLLENTDEWRKANIASAVVLLGLLPTILGLTGSHVAELAIVGCFRPFLTFFLICAAPGMNPSPALTSMDPLSILEARKRGRGFRLPKWAPGWVVVLAEYGAVTGALINLIFTLRGIQIGTVISFAPTHGLYWIWLIAAYLVFLVGYYALLARVTRNTLRVPDNRLLQYIWRWSPKICHVLQCLKLEFTTTLPGQDMSLTLKRETSFFILLSWLNAVGTALHLLLGTILFSSTLFIATGDAFVIGARILASHLVCRIVAAFELAGLRATVRADYGDEENQSIVEQLDHSEKNPESTQVKLVLSTSV